MIPISTILHSEHWKVAPANNVYSWLDLTHWSADNNINGEVRVYFDSVKDIDKWIAALQKLKDSYGYKVYMCVNKQSL